MDGSRRVVASPRIHCNGGRPASETLCGRAVQRRPGTAQACLSQPWRIPKRSWEARRNCHWRTVERADYGRVCMETGAHFPGEPAVPGGERADAGVPAAAALAPTNTLLLDRELERGQIDRVLEAARRGRSAALVLHGEPGTGKTTLLDYAVESGGGFEVVRLLGIESESDRVWFCGAASAFAAVFGRAQVSSGTAAGHSGRGARSSPCGFPGRFLVALAALTMLAGAAAKRPLLCIVDDAQWLDRESAGVLGFVARRFSADAVAMLFAVRGPSECAVGLEGIPWVRIGGLPPDEAGQLLASAVAGRVDRGVSERVIAQTGGNPLGLIDLGGELSREQLAGEISLPDLLPLGGSLQARYLRQIRRLPGETQIFLLAAAADPTGDPALLWRAGEFLGFGVRAAAPAEVEGLLRFCPLVRFRHPLIRSAVYHGATLAGRVRVHEALARATDPQVAADLRAWHGRGLPGRGRSTRCRPAWAANRRSWCTWHQAVDCPDPGHTTHGSAGVTGQEPASASSSWLVTPARRRRPDGCG